jgi:hypothetical protein
MVKELKTVKVTIFGKNHVSLFPVRDGDDWVFTVVTKNSNDTTLSDQQKFEEITNTKLCRK